MSVAWRTQLFIPASVLWGFTPQQPIAIIAAPDRSATPLIGDSLSCPDLNFCGCFPSAACILSLEWDACSAYTEDGGETDIQEGGISWGGRNVARDSTELLLAADDLAAASQAWIIKK